MRHCQQIHAVSCDEVFVDLTAVVQPLTGSDSPGEAAARPTAAQLIARIRQEIADELGIAASAGVAHNALLARMCTRVAKPNGQHVLLPADALEFVGQRGIDELPGIGWSHARKLCEEGVETCTDLQQVPRARLQVNNK